MKWYAIPVKYDLWFVFGLAGLAWALVGGVFLYVAEPYLVLEEKRVSDQPETIRVEYREGDCSASSHLPCILSRFQTATQATEEDADGTQRTVTRWADVSFGLLEGVPCPDYSDLTVEGNELLVTGYRYRTDQRNILTGSIEEDPSATRIDLIAWEAVVPYAVSDHETGSKVTAPEKKTTEPVAHRTTEEDHSRERYPVRDSSEILLVETCLRLSREQKP